MLLVYALIGSPFIFGLCVVAFWIGDCAGYQRGRQSAFGSFVGNCFALFLVVAPTLMMAIGIVEDHGYWDAAAIGIVEEYGYWVVATIVVLLAAASTLWGLHCGTLAAPKCADDYPDDCEYA